MSDHQPPLTPLAVIAASQHKALSWAAVFAVAAIVYVLEPLGIGILLGTLFAFMSQPLFAKLNRRFGNRMGAILTVTITTLIVAASLVGLGWLLASKGAVHARELMAAVGPDSPNGGVLMAVGKWTSYVGIEGAELGDRIRSVAESGVAKFAALGAAILSMTASSLLVLFFMMLTMHFVLRNAALVIRLTADALPLKREWTMELLAEFRRVGKTTLFGTIVTGASQGVLATVGYWVCGVPDPIFYGVATAVASLVPAVGTMLVWVPVGVVMIIIGHPIGGVIELIWGALIVVGVSDYVIRPRLIGGGESELPSLLTFAALFGGVEVFGLKGLIVGPVVMSLAFSVLRLYTRESNPAPLILSVAPGKIQTAETIISPPPPSAPAKT